MKIKNSELYQNILEEIKNNSKITEEELAKKYLVSERTIRRYIKELKEKKKIILKNVGKKREWKLIEEEYIN